MGTFESQYVFDVYVDRRLIKFDSPLLALFDLYNIGTICGHLLSSVRVRGRFGKTLWPPSPYYYSHRPTVVCNTNQLLISDNRRSDLCLRVLPTTLLRGPIVEVTGTSLLYVNINLSCIIPTA